MGSYVGKNYEPYSDDSNNDLVIPMTNRLYIVIPIFVYLTDVSMDLGPPIIVIQKV